MDYQNYNQIQNEKKYTISRWSIFVVIAAIVGVFLWIQAGDWIRSGIIISLNPQTANVNVGDTFKVDIVLNTEGQPIDGVDIYSLHYDPTVLKVVDDIPNQKNTQIKPGVILPINTANIVDETTGTIKFGQIVSGGTTYTGSGVLATINFKAIGKGTSNLKFDFNRGSTVDTNVAYNGKDQLSKVVDATYFVK